MNHDRGAVRMDTWLSSLLWAIAKKAGGEIRLSGYDLDDVPDQCAVMTDYDPTDHCFVIRAHSGATETIIINRSQQWTASQKPNSTASSETSSENQNKSRSAVPSDQDLAEIERRLLQRGAERARQKEQEEYVRAQRGES